MQRRQFLAAGLATAVASRRLMADRLPRDVKITRIVGFTLPSRRPKLVGKNSRLDVHGDQARDQMARIYTSSGVDGLGYCRAKKEDLARLLGTSPAEYFQQDPPRMLGPLGRGDMPLWDLAAKLLDKPACELLGGKGTAPVPVYDGSIYFADLLPQYADRWQDRFKEEIDMGLAAGHRAFKVKIGRGAKWMARASGDRRDVEVIELVRKHAGRDVLVGVDANNGYDLEGTKRFLDRAGDLDLAFVEEMFPEEIEACLELKRFIAGRGWKTLLADGETQGSPEPLKPFIEAGAIDVLQGDMRRFGFGGILTEADWARAHGLLVAPHNWGSLVGFYMQLHVGRAIRNFYRAEHDPLSSDLLIAEGYRIENGTCTVPDAPGFGLKVHQQKLRQQKMTFDLRL
jgi:L-alanine-DL-glutamate epimerase-like enolase superfamily enzyme